MSAFNHHSPYQPGREQSMRLSHSLHVNPSEGPFARTAFNYLTSQEGKIGLGAFGGVLPYVANYYTVTLDTPGGAFVAPGVNGVAIRTATVPVANDDFAITGLLQWPMQSDKWVDCGCRINVSSVAEMGFNVGVITAGVAEVNSANPTDGVFVIKTPAGTGLTLRVVSNGAAAVDQALTGIVLTSGADVVIRVIFLSSVAGINAGEVWVGVPGATNYTDLTWTKFAFTTAQLTALADMVTNTPPNLVEHLGTRVNNTNPRTATVGWFGAEADR